MDVAASCLVLTALFAYINHRFIGLTSTIGVMLVALVLSITLIMLDKLGLGALRDYETSLLQHVDFSDVLMNGMLSLLLFAGALHIDWCEMKKRKSIILLFAVGGTVISTVLIGFGLWWLIPHVGIALPLSFCLLFGALISPTDPIAVLGIMKSVQAPKELEIIISGESLFNDGVGVVLFSLLLTFALSGAMPTFSQAAILLAKEAGGGLIFGLLLGLASCWLLKSIDNYQVEILITLATVIGGYALANHMHISGPLAMVVAGLVIGNRGRAAAMSDLTRQHLDLFWSLLDDILNAVLFVLIGLEILVIEFSGALIWAAMIAIVIALCARGFSVGVPAAALQKFTGLSSGTWQILTWGGLRGGISVALALSLPAGHERDITVALTYGVVVFAILVQGLSMRRAIRLWLK